MTTIDQPSRGLDVDDRNYERSGEDRSHEPVTFSVPSRVPRARRQLGPRVLRRSPLKSKLPRHHRNRAYAPSSFDKTPGSGPAHRRSNFAATTSAKSDTPSLHPHSAGRRIMQRPRAR